jgi:hypothetical protein
MKYATLTALLLLATPALAAPDSGLAPLAADQARSNIGQNVVIEGTASVHDADARLGVYIDLDRGPGGVTFAGYIPNENLANFPGLRSLDGRRVAITGVVQIRKEGFPIIIMTNSRQLRPAG